MASPRCDQSKHAPGIGVRVAALDATGAIALNQAGVLDRVVIHKKGAAANILTLYDGIDATGTVIAIIDTTDRVGSIEFGRKLLVGLFYKLETGTAADLSMIVR